MEHTRSAIYPKKSKKMFESISMSEIFWQFGAFAAAFLLTRARVSGNLSPFALAFAAAAPSGLSLLAAAGACLGYSFAGLGWALLLRNIAALCSAVLIRYLFHRFFGEGRNVVFVCLVPAATCLSTGFALLLSQGFTVNSALLLGSETALAGGMAWFFNTTFHTLRRGKTFFFMERQEIAALVVCCSVLLMALGGYQIWNVTPAHILGAFAVLCAAFVLGEGGGAIAGICVGMALYAAQGNGFLCAVFGVGGLLAGLFAPLGQLAAAAVFSLACALIAILEGSTGAAALLFETAASAALFVALPKRAFVTARKYLRMHEESGMLSLPDAREEEARRLHKAAQAMQAVCSCVDEVAGGLENIEPQFYQIQPEKVREQVCNACGAADFCWNERGESVQESFSQAALLLQAEGHILPKDFSKSLREACARTGELAIAFNRQQLDIAAKRSARIRVQQMRDIVSDQFRSMSSILHDLSQSCAEQTSPLPEGTKRVKQVLQKFEIPFYDVQLLRNSLGRTALRVCVARLPESLHMPKLLQALQDACGVRLEHPEHIAQEQGYILHFAQSVSYRLHLGTLQYPVGDNAVCGDYYTCFRDGHGRQLLLLSDGMGTGSRAAVDSAMAAELFMQLVLADLSPECALEIVNAALLIKSGDESLATLDVACIDLYTGKTEFYKAGAAASFVRRKHRTGALEQASLPAGILREVQFARANASLGDGDVVVLVSDGAVTDDNREILKTLRNWEGTDAAELARQIAELSANTDEALRKDDLTVIAAVLERV